MVAPSGWKNERPRSEENETREHDPRRGFLESLESRNADPTEVVWSSAGIMRDEGSGALPPKTYPSLVYPPIRR